VQPDVFNCVSAYWPDPSPHAQRMTPHTDAQSRQVLLKLPSGSGVIPQLLPSLVAVKTPVLPAVFVICPSITSAHFASALPAIVEPSPSVHVIRVESVTVAVPVVGVTPGPTGISVASLASVTMKSAPGDRFFHLNWTSHPPVAQEPGSFEAVLLLHPATVCAPIRAHPTSAERT
jgi:hypothetical protein